MPYVQDVTEPLIKTLNHTAGLPVHQLAGHAANLPFWVGEVAHAFEVIDGYSQRFGTLQQGERRYVEETGIDLNHLPAPPLRPEMHDHELKELRRRLADSVYHLLSRCYKHGLIDDAELEAFDQRLSLYAEDIKRE